MMKILIVTDAPVKDISGVSTVVQHTVDYFVSNGHEVKVFSPKFKATQNIVNEFPPNILHEFNGLSLAWLGHRELTLTIPIWGFWRKMRRFNPDVVQVLDTQLLGAVGVLCARASKRPIIAVCSTNSPQFAKYQTKVPFVPTLVRWFTRVITNRAHVVLAPSQAMCDILTASKFKPSQVWTLGVETDIYTPKKRDEDLRQKLLDKGQFGAIALYVGRLAKEKNIDALLSLAQNTYGVRLVIVGDGPDKSRLEKLFANTSTHFTGYVVGEDLARMFASGDIFVFPALAETFGHVVLQSMASGIPVVAMNSPASAEHARNSKQAILLTSENPDELRDATLALLKDPQQCQQMAEHGIIYAQTMTWTKVFEHLEDYLAQVQKIAYQPK